MARFESVNSLRSLNHSLMENVVSGNEMFQITGKASSNMLLETVVVEKEHLRHGSPIPFGSLMKKFGFEVSDGHDNHRFDAKKSSPLPLSSGGRFTASAVTSGPVLAVGGGQRHEPEVQVATEVVAERSSVAFRVCAAFSARHYGLLGSSAQVSAMAMIHWAA